MEGTTMFTDKAVAYQRSFDFTFKAKIRLFVNELFNIGLFHFSSELVNFSIPLSPSLIRHLEPRRLDGHWGEGQAGFLFGLLDYVTHISQ